MFLGKEPVVICIWWADDCFVIDDDFIGMHPLKRTTADEVVAKEYATEYASGRQTTQVAPCKIHPPQLLKVTDLPRMW